MAPETVSRIPEDIIWMEENKLQRNEAMFALRLRVFLHDSGYPLTLPDDLKISEIRNDVRGNYFQPAKINSYESNFATRHLRGLTRHGLSTIGDARKADSDKKIYQLNLGKGKISESFVRGLLVPEEIVASAASSQSFNRIQLNSYNQSTEVNDTINSLRNYRGIMAYQTETPDGYVFRDKAEVASILGDMDYMLDGDVSNVYIRKELSKITKQYPQIRTVADVKALVHGRKLHKVCILAGTTISTVLDNISNPFRIK